MRTIYKAISITLGLLATTLFSNECCAHSFQSENDVEKQGELECWMTTPFKSSFEEEELVLEYWMTTPFNSNLEEEELVLECWMTSPFKLLNTQDVVRLQASDENVS